MSPDWRYSPVSTTRNPVDRILAHMPELLAAVLGIGLGITHISKPDTQLNLEPLPLIMSYSLSAFMILGGILWIYATLHRFRTINKYWLWLRWGLALSAFSWFAYFIAAIGLRPEAVTVWMTYLVISMVPTSVWYISFITEKTIRTRRG